MTKASDSWTACDSQEITQLAARIRGRRGRRAAARAAFAAAATTATVALLAMAVWAFPGADEEHNFAGISCGRVGELAEAYQNKELSPDLQDQIRRHVALCPICRERMEGLTAVSQRSDVVGGRLPDASKMLAKGDADP